MKVAIVSDAIYPYNLGGKETRIYRLSTLLAKDGYDVHIYTMKWWSEPSKTRLENGVWLHAISPLYPLHHGERRSIKQGVLFGVSCLKLLGEQFDVVDVDHMPYFPLFFMKVVSLLKRRPMIATWHEVWGLKYWRNYLGTAGMLAYALEKLTVLMPSKIIAASNLTATRLRADMKASQDVMVVNNGIDLAAIKQIRAARQKSDLIYVGRLLEHKHVEMLLETVAVLKVKRPDITCNILGDGPERENLEQLSHQLGLDDNVRFWGFVPENSQVYGLMKASKVFVSASTREGFGISVLEANGCGLPVVVVNHPANAAMDLVSELNGRITEFSAADIARGAEELLSRPTRRPAITAFAANYDWQHSAAALREVYAS